MKKNRLTSRRILRSDLERVDNHKIKPEEYSELPELTDEMLRRGTVKRAGRPIAKDPRKQVTIRPPESVLAAWKASGPGWQTRMAKVLTEIDLVKQ